MSDALTPLRGWRGQLPGRRAAMGHLAMLAHSALVAGSFALGGLAAPLIHPLALNTLRFALAAMVVGGLLLALGGARREHFAAPWRFVLLGGLFGTYFGMMFWGLQSAEPVSMAAVFTLTPVMAAGFGWAFMRQRTSARMGLALALAATGAIWVIFDADWARLAAFQVGRGEVIFFFGCIAHAAYVPLVPRLSRGEPVLAMTFGMLVAGTVCLGLVGAGAIVETDWAALPGIVWLAIAYLALLAGALTFFLVQFAAMRLPGAKVMGYTYLIPAWVILWQGALGSDWPRPAILAGVALVILGLVLLLRDEPRQ